MHIYIIMQAVLPPINTQTVCGFMQLCNILCILFRVRLQKVYKKYIESARRRWYNMDRKNKKGGENMSTKTERELEAIREVLVMIASILSEIAEAIKNR